MEACGGKIIPSEMGKSRKKWEHLNGIECVMGVESSNRMHRIHLKHVPENLSSSEISAGQGHGWMGSDNFSEDQKKITQK